ncbi:hypothetical protein HMN09_01201400 [Mycena chlorophos]|uniref:Golgi apparatus membrane protein TVP38 n=1 Tax=Mycena chlorophos TaxID=658473 RepID=A0A8H6S7I7_MYCCL|nr:hypothetical protein HMN09_01201400 [Mycena chlorophos]
MSSGNPPMYYPQASYSSSSFDLPSKVPRDNPRDSISSRTPEPTLQESNFLQGIKEKKSTKQKFLFYGLAAVLLVAVVLISIYHEKIIDDLAPVTDWLSEHKFGPLIPIVILIAMSFPPLFGHEIVAMLAGVTWDLPEAFLIVAVGTLLGEIANFFVFKSACSARGAKMEQKDLSYGVLAHVVREGGFLVVLVVRYSAIPPHFATTVFSTVGISFGVFIGAAILSLPKALVPVYIGWALRPENSGNKTSNIIEKAVLVASIIVTIVAYRWINKKMEDAKEAFVYSRRKARQFGSSSAALGLPMV